MPKYLPAYAKYDLLFSPQRIPALKDMRGKKWRVLVSMVAELPETHPDALALALTVIELSGCETCEKDSYRAQLGCATCARRTLLRFKGTDDMLLREFEPAREKIITPSSLP